MGTQANWTAVLTAAVCAALLGCDRPTDAPEERQPYRLPAVSISAADAKPKGLLLITVDTLRADYLSSYGHARVLTPSFDRLAAGGILFRQAVSQATTTTPSHASLMTGMYVKDHNVYSNFEAIGQDPVTMAEAFKAAGFATFAAVNMRHMNPEISGFGQGFDTYIKSGFMRRAGPTIDMFLDWVDKQSGPYFAWLHLADVHTPYRPPPPYNYFYYDGDERDPAKRSLGRIWPLLPTHMSDHPFFRSWLEGITDLEWVQAQYQGAVTYVDDQIGRLLDELEDRRLLSRTGVVLTSDHGECMGEHDMYFVHTGLYESTVHIPLITYLPGSGREGVQVRDLVESVDVLPTVLEYFDIPTPITVRGRSLWPLIEGEVVEPKVALIEHAGRNLVALRSERYKYIRHLRTRNLQPSYPFVEGREELYDLKKDPRERVNLASRKPNMVKVFRKDLEGRMQNRMAMETGKADLSEETVEILRALGYVR